MRDKAYFALGFFVGLLVAGIVFWSIVCTGPMSKLSSQNLEVFNLTEQQQQQQQQQGPPPSQSETDALSSTRDIEAQNGSTARSASSLSKNTGNGFQEPDAGDELPSRDMEIENVSAPHSASSLSKNNGVFEPAAPLRERVQRALQAPCVQRPDGKKKLKLKHFHGIDMWSPTTPRDCRNVRGVLLSSILVTLRARHLGETILKRLTPIIRVDTSVKPDTKLGFIDMGARQYPRGSTQTFLERYPRAREFHAYAFDAVEEYRKTYPLAQLNGKLFRSFEFFHAAVWTSEGNTTFVTSGLKLGTLNTTFVPFTRRDRVQTQVVRTIDAAKFLRDHFTVDDFVVVKMDIEGAEWSVLAHLIATGALELVDELMLECHLNYPVKRVMGQECVDLFNHMRHLGIPTHQWM